MELRIMNYNFLKMTNIQYHLLKKCFKTFLNKINLLKYLNKIYPTNLFSTNKQTRTK